MNLEIYYHYKRKKLDKNNNRLKTLIAFTGRARSGKDTAATFIDIIERERGQILAHFAFADILKDITHTSLNLNKLEVAKLKTMTSVKVANGLTLREFYNTLGDAIKNHFGADAWDKIILRELQELIPLVDTVVCTDLRYPIEERDLRKFCEVNNIKFIIIKMKNLNQTQRTTHLGVDEHESEYLVDQIKEDYLITARDTEEIEERINEILETERKENAA